MRGGENAALYQSQYVDSSHRRPNVGIGPPVALALTQGPEDAHIYSDVDCDTPDEEMVHANPRFGGYFAAQEPERLG